MKITAQENVQRTVTVTPLERLDALTAPAFRQYVEQLLETGVVHFIVDLSATPFMDSAGMAVLVTLLRKCRAAGGGVKLVWPKSEAVRRTLQLTQFDKVFEMI